MLNLKERFPVGKTSKVQGGEYLWKTLYKGKMTETVSLSKYFWTLLYLCVSFVCLSGSCSSASSWPGCPCLQHFLHHYEVCCELADLGTDRQASCRPGPPVWTHTCVHIFLDQFLLLHTAVCGVCFILLCFSGTGETPTTACCSMMKSTRMNRWSTRCRKPLTAARKKLWALPPLWTEMSVQFSNSRSSYMHVIWSTLSCYTYIYSTKCM